jgi:hypothetical protein
MVAASDRNACDESALRQSVADIEERPAAPAPTLRRFEEGSQGRVTFLAAIVQHHRDADRRRIDRRRLMAVQVRQPGPAHHVAPDLRCIGANAE